MVDAEPLPAGASFLQTVLDCWSVAEPPLLGLAFFFYRNSEYSVGMTNAPEPVPA
jgi:hypothetical protein